MRRANPPSHDTAIVAAVAGHIAQCRVRLHAVRPVALTLDASQKARAAAWQKAGFDEFSAVRLVLDPAMRSRSGS